MLIFPVQSIAYFHVVLVVRHTLKYLFLIVLNYRVIDAYIFLRYLVNKCTHIMHNLQQHMLRVLLFFTVKFYWSTTLSRKPFLFFDCVDYSLLPKPWTFIWIPRIPFHALILLINSVLISTYFTKTITWLWLPSKFTLKLDVTQDKTTTSVQCLLIYEIHGVHP